MVDKESKSLSKQLKRYAQVGGVVGKLATQLAGQKYLGVKLDKDKHAAEIRSALGGIKGPLMKVAQLSATIPDLLPDVGKRYTYFPHIDIDYTSLHCVTAHHIVSHHTTSYHPRMHSRVLTSSHRIIAQNYHP